MVCMLESVKGETIQRMSLRSTMLPSSSYKKKINHISMQSWTRLKRLSMHECIGEGNGNPHQYSCLENPIDRRAWWAAVYGVSQHRAQLKRLSSSINMQALLSLILEDGPL